MSSPQREKVQRPDVSDAHPPFEHKIRQRAHEIWIQRGGQDGSDIEDWLQAEGEILSVKQKF
jgi:hypothetical protein